MKIEKMSKEEMPKLMELYTNSIIPFFDSEKWEYNPQLIEKNMEKYFDEIHNYKIKENGIFVGFINFFYKNNFFNGKKTCFIPLILVHNDYQRQGLGKKLVEFVENNCKEKGVKKIFVEADTNNENALKFYEKQGFVETQKTLKKEVPL